MDNIVLEYGKSLFKQRFGREPFMRCIDKTVAASSLEHYDARNEIWILYDVSENDQAFKIVTDTDIVSNSEYFANTVPTRPYEFSGNVLINTTGASSSNVFTFLVFY